MTPRIRTVSCAEAADVAKAKARPAAVSVQRVSHGQEAETNPRFDIREQKPIARLHVTTAGDYTVRVQVKPYTLPQQRAFYPGRQILLGPYVPATPLLDQTRLLLLAVLLALSVLIMFRPRRMSPSEPAPVAQPA